MMVFIPRTYPKAAGLQSEIGRVAVTQIAHWENDYRRQIHLAKVDMKRNIREIKHSRSLLHRSMLHYSNKLKEYKRAKENKYYKKLLEERRAKNERRNIPVSLTPMDVYSEEVLAEIMTKSIPHCVELHDEGIEVNAFTGDETQPLVTLQLDALDEPDVDSDVFESKQDGVKSPNLQAGGKSLEVAGEKKMKLPDFASRKYKSEEQSSQNSLKVNNDRFEEGLSTKDLSSSTIDSSLSNKRRRKHGTSVTHTDIIKLQYTTDVRHLFRAVDALAKVHGVEAPKPVKREIPDPRDSAQHLKTTKSAHLKTDFLTLPSDYLYNMKYGYAIPEEGTDSHGCVHVTPLTDYGSHSQSRTVSPRDSDRSSLTIHPLVSPSDGIHLRQRGSVPHTMSEERDSVKFKQDASTPSRSSSDKLPSLQRGRKESAKREHSKASIRLPPLVATSSILKAGKVVFHTIPTSLSDDVDEGYMRRIKSSTDDSVPWQTAFGILKNVHFLGKNGV